MPQPPSSSHPTPQGLRALLSRVAEPWWSGRRCKKTLAESIPHVWDLLRATVILTQISQWRKWNSMKHWLLLGSGENEGILENKSRGYLKCKFQAFLFSVHSLPGGLFRSSLGHVPSVLLYLCPLIYTVIRTKGGINCITALGPCTRPHLLITVHIETPFPNHLQLTPPSVPTKGIFIAEMRAIGVCRINHQITRTTVWVVH